MKKIFTMICAFLTAQAIAATNPKTAYQLTKEGKAVIVDVREEDEVKAGMIDGALWFPLSKIKKDEDWKKEFQKMVGDKQVFLHCRSGRRSEEVMNILKQNGLQSENLGGYETLKTELPIKSK